MQSHLSSVLDQLCWEPLPVRIRARTGQGGETDAIDTTDAILVWEPRRVVPMYAVPPTDILGEVVPQDRLDEIDLDGLPRVMGPEDFARHTVPGAPVSLRFGDSELKGAGFVTDDPDLEGRVLVDFAAFTAWRVEDEPLVGHPHDPFKRIDVVRSTREVRVELDGTVLASSRRPMMLLETHLPPRWYLPREDVETGLLVPSDTRSTCAYKGHASYLSMADGRADDIAWTYPEPLHDAEQVRGDVCFWAERTDLFLDGVPLDRPRTLWSPPEDRGAERLPPD